MRAFTELDMDSLQINTAFADKVARGIFGPAVRRIPDDACEDRLADAIAQTWQMFDRYARQGTVLPDAILVHSCRQRAQDLSRHFVLVGDGRRGRDVYNPKNDLDGQLDRHEAAGRNPPPGRARGDTPRARRRRGARVDYREAV